MQQVLNVLFVARKGVVYANDAVAESDQSVAKVQS
jgi:hypothetical protein